MRRSAFGPLLRRRRRAARRSYPVLQGMLRRPGRGISGSAGAAGPKSTSPDSPGSGEQADMKRMRGTQYPGGAMAV